MNSVQERPGLPQGRPRTLLGIVNAFGTLILQLSNVLSEMGYRINRVLPKDGTEAMTAPLELMTYTVATLPTAADYEGAVIYVSDGGAGAVFRGSNGTSWVNLG